MRLTCLRFVVFVLVILHILLRVGVSAPAYAAPRAQDVAPAAVASVVINEIHYDPTPAAATLEYVELFNTGAQALSLTGWRLEGGIDYDFPVGTTLPAHGFLVVALDPMTVRNVYGAATVVGPFRGRLSNEGDRLTLRNARAQTVDEVEYGVGFPWPVTGYMVDHAIHLINTALDNALPGAWRAGPPSPGAPNVGLTDNPPPLVHSVEHQPQTPRSTDAVTIRARVTDSDGIANVTLWLQVVRPGAYIRIDTPAYATAWTPYTMQPAGDDVYALTLPADVVQHRNLLRYRVEARDSGGRSVMTPAADDPQPNFALYVYDGVPSWRGAVNPVPGAIAVTYDFNQMRALPVYQLIAANLDVLNAQFLPGTTFFQGYMGSDYLWRGTLVYDGVVYDHIGFRARGQTFRYATGKNKWKFNFLPGHRFQAKDNYGRPYPVKWDKLNLASGMQHANRGYRGEHGLFEALSARVFGMAGVPAPATQFVHFRVVDHSYETSANQYDTDFWGLYLAVEELDGRFLKARNLPDGNLFKMKDWSGDLQNQGIGQPGDRSDLSAFIGNYTWGRPDAAWWRANFDLDNYYRFRAVLEAVHHYDVDEGKNYFYFHNPVDGKWAIWPWDLDLTWADTFYGVGAEPFRDRVLNQPDFALAYQNELRSVRDLIFNAEQMNLLIDELVAVIDTPAGGASMVDADRAMWDFNPILESRYVIENRARKGAFYRQAPTRDFAGMVQLMRDWVTKRTTWIDQTLLTDQAFPATPTLRYTGRAGFPADDLTFAPGAFSSPQGAAFAGMQWLAAEVAWPGLTGYAVGAPNRYEAETAWTSPIYTTFTSTFTVPNGVCRAGATCRVRVRMLDSTGRWSHWSAPQQFVVGAPAQAVTRALQVTEIMYNPLDWGNVPGDELEFLEIKNIGNATLDLSNLRLTNAVEYTFPVATQLAPGAFVVVAENAVRFEARYGIAPSGQYRGQLDNGGETLEVRDAFNRTIFSITYDDREGWPAFADGLGYSLVTNALGDPTDVNQPAYWRASTVTGGSPGADDPVAVVFNEFLFDPATKQLSAIELYNPAPHPVDVSGWTVTERWVNAPRYGAMPGHGARLPANSVMPANGYLVVPVAKLSQPLTIGVGPGVLVLNSAATAGWLTGYVHAVTIFAPAYADALGRVVLAGGESAYVPQSSTPGAANGEAVVAPITITRIKLLPEGAVQWVEVTNHTDTAIPLFATGAPTVTWMIDQLLFQFPPGVTLGAHERLLIANLLPAIVCTQDAPPQGRRVLGGAALPPAAGGGALRLLAPQPTNTTGVYTYAVVDEVRFDGVERLRLRPDATLWQRSADADPGFDPASWLASNAPLTADDAPTDPADLCAFDVYRDAEGHVRVEWVTRALPAEQHFVLWRSMSFDRSAAVVVADDEQVRAVEASGAFHWVDLDLTSDAQPFYWLQLRTEAGASDVALSGVRTPMSINYLPIVAQQP
ncbi:MAG TPA: hypothetical protein DCL15_14140 [Chloroflexi bacterium]|nr:hypothetical protein [Chloroflexota bacterium]HHW88739.1 hypothetical protein [Chloroflexota bacterium]